MNVRKLWNLEANQLSVSASLIISAMQSHNFLRKEKEWQKQYQDMMLP